MKIKHLLAIGLLCSICFSACSDSDDDKDNGWTEPVEKVLSNIAFMSFDPTIVTSTLPYSVESYSFKVDDKNRLTELNRRYDKSTVAYFTDSMLVALVANNTGVMGYDTLKISLKDNRITKIINCGKTVFPDRTSINETLEYTYTYSNDGYLTQIDLKPTWKEATTAILKQTVENGNITQQTTRESYNSARSMVSTFTYDDKEYIPLSDWTLESPLSNQVLNYRFPMFDGLVGKQSKNNVKNVVMTYPEGQNSNFYYNKLSYTHEFVKDSNKLLRVHLSGVLNGTEEFKGLSTYFGYGDED